jgi:hypothetical protein
MKSTMNESTFLESSFTGSEPAKSKQTEIDLLLDKILSNPSIDCTGRRPIPWMKIEELKAILDRAFPPETRVLDRATQQMIDELIISDSFSGTTEDKPRAIQPETE